MAQLEPGPIPRQAGKETRSAPAGKAFFKAILSEDMDGKTFPAFPPSARLAVIIGQASEPGPYMIRVKAPSGVKMMPHRHPEDRIYTVTSGIFYIGFGDEFDADKLEAYPPGAVIVLSGNTFALPLGEVWRPHHPGDGDWAVGHGIRQFEGRSKKSELQRVKHGTAIDDLGRSGNRMIIAKIGTSPLRIPFKPGNKAVASTCCIKTFRLRILC
jgi:hypothetical protein